MSGGEGEGNGNSDDEHEAHTPTADEAMAALAALASAISKETGDVASALMGLVRETSSMSVTTALEFDRKIAAMLGGIIAAQDARIKRLEKIAVALIADRREKRKGER